MNRDEYLALSIIVDGMNFPPLYDIDALEKTGEYIILKTGEQVYSEWLTQKKPQEILPVDQRKIAYANEKLILWENEEISVDDANMLWVAYSAEGSPKAEELHNLISKAKQKIRDEYPDEH